MFGIFASQDKKMRVTAGNWLEVADRVWHFRRDQLSESEASELRAATEALRTDYAAKAGAAKLKLSIERLEPTLRKHGGRVYPKTALVENVEFFLVASIVILGIRTYFVQPFKIPTNSMWPSFYGMTAESYKTAAEKPGPVMQALRFVTLGAQHYEAVAPISGEVSADFFANGALAYSEVPGRHWLVFPATLHQYTFHVGDTPVSVSVPEDFHSMEKILGETLFKGAPFIVDDGDLTRGEQTIVQSLSGLRRANRVKLGVSVKQGEPIASFDILTGDQLFVDRVSYHFVRPTVGSGFVFRTDHIDSPEMKTEDGQQQMQYYIKRLVGVPGDTIAIKEPVLYRNGQPITGSRAFERNANREGKYPGYQNIRSLSVGRTMKVPPRSFLALGDNSPDSADSRYWGYVPEKDVIGRPLFVYYPFTLRWGPPH